MLSICVFNFGCLVLKMECIFILKVLIEEELLEMGEVMVGFVVSFFVWINGVEFVDKLNLDLCMLILFVIKW